MNSSNDINYIGYGTEIAPGIHSAPPSPSATEPHSVGSPRIAQGIGVAIAMIVFVCAVNFLL